MLRRFVVVILTAIFLAGCPSPTPTPQKAKATSKKKRKSRYYQRGMASWYGGKFHGRKTASGEIYNMNKMTAAHKKLPFGTRVKVTNRKNGRSVIVRITDRGPYAKGRVIDLSKAAAERLRMIDAGVVPVTIRILR